MFSLLVLVLDDPNKLTEVLAAWEEAGVPGVTVLESTGFARLRQRLRQDDLPLLPSLRTLFQAEEVQHNTLFSIVDDEAVIERTIAATQRIVGDLSQPNTGILFVLPVSRVVGGQRGCARAAKG